MAYNLVAVVIVVFSYYVSVHNVAVSLVVHLVVAVVVFLSFNLYINTFSSFLPL